MTFRRIDHTAVAVKDLDEAIPRYERLYGSRCHERVLVSDQQVEIAFIRFGDTQIELISPVDKDNGVGRFLSARGEGLHHIGMQVDDIVSELERLAQGGVRLIDTEARPGVHGLIAFVHPEGTGGVLLELIQPL